MNHLIADNRVSTLRTYLTDKLGARYDEREAANLTQELFNAFNGWNRTDVVFKANERMGESELLKYHFALKRLLQGEPLQYVLQFAWFLDMKLHVNKNVLIPRPETEELVRLIVNRNTKPNPRILDVGTGSGCIALALKKLLPEAIVTAVDVSEDALSIARKNAESLAFNIDFVNLDILTSTPEGRFDIIVSNPPYIPLSEKDSMAEHVTEHEPHVALFTADDDALIFYRRLMALSAEILEPLGTVFCEIHEDKANVLLQLAKHYPIQASTIYTDLQGKNRMMSWSN
jgi:release factor glutamine methyltransferase